MLRKFSKISLLCLCLLESCARVNVSPDEDLCCIQSEIECKTGKTIFWDTSVCGAICTLEIDELIQNDLTEELAIELALLNNPKLQALYQSIGVTKANLAQAGLPPNPIFSFAYQFTVNSNVSALINASFLQNFLDILLIPMKKTVACEELEQMTALVTGRVLDTLAQTKSAYYTFLAAQEILALKKQMLLAAELSYEAACRLSKAGNLPEVEVTIEKSMYQQMKLSVASAEIDVLNARESLNVAMGLYGRQIDWKTASKLPAVPNSCPTYDDIENHAVVESLDLKAAYHDLLATAARFGIKTTRLILPQFDLGASAEREDGIWYVGPGINLAIPLFDWGRVNSSKAHSMILQLWNQFTALAIEVRSKARSARFSLLNARRQAQYSHEVIIPLAEKVTHLTLLQHNAMSFGVFRLLQTKRVELEKKEEYIQLLKEFWIQQIGLETLLQGRMLDFPMQEVRP